MLTIIVLAVVAVPVNFYAYGFILLFIIGTECGSKIDRYPAIEVEETEITSCMSFSEFIASELYDVADWSYTVEPDEGDKLVIGELDKVIGMIEDGTCYGLTLNSTDGCFEFVFTSGSNLHSLDTTYLYAGECSNCRYKIDGIPETAPLSKFAWRFDVP